MEGAGEPVSGESGTFAIFMDWDRYMGYLRRWEDGELSAYNTFEALVREIAETNGRLDRAMDPKAAP